MREQPSTFYLLLVLREAKVQIFSSPFSIFNFQFFTNFPLARVGQRAPVHHQRLPRPDDDAASARYVQFIGMVSVARELMITLLF